MNASMRKTLGWELGDLGFKSCSGGHPTYDLKQLNPSGFLFPHL